jgi:hypothetical protein
VRADLARYYPGHTLRELFSGEMTPDECWDLITHLPRTSATTGAIYADPETVIGDEPAETPLTDFSPEVQAAAHGNDLLTAILVNLIALGGGKPPKLQPYPRPGEARRRRLKAELREQARQEWAELCAQMGVPV